VSERVKRPVAACLACVLALLVVASLSFRTESFQHLDARALIRISAERETSLADVAGLVARLGDPLPQLAILLGLVCVVALALGGPRLAAGAVVLVVGANLTTQVLKSALEHSRYQLSLGYEQIGSTAFPSGHATATAALALAAVLVVPRRWRPAAMAIGACLVVAVGCSVILLRRHYPSDVVGGVLIAAAWYFAVVAGLRQLETPGSKRF
jgi:membrane-associated phospholipid phosphatase